MIEAKKLGREVVATPEPQQAKSGGYFGGA